MKIIPDDILLRAEAALAAGPLYASNLADLAWPDRVGRPVASRSRAGHALARELIACGRALQRSDGRFAATTPAPLDVPPLPQPAPFAELHVDPTSGEVVEVQRRSLGHVAMPPTPAQPAEDGELVVDANGTVTRVRRELLGRASLPPRLTPPPVQQQLSPPMPTPMATFMHQPPMPLQQQAPPQSAFSAWLNAKMPEVLAIRVFLQQAAHADPTAQRMALDVVRPRMYALWSDMNVWFRAYGLPQVPLAGV